MVRDGEQSIIDSNQLVPGDIVILEEGDSVPADLRIVDNSNLELIESILTGESVPTSKNIKKIMTKVCYYILFFEELYFFYLYYYQGSFVIIFFRHLHCIVIDKESSIRRL